MASSILLLAGLCVFLGLINIPSLVRSADPDPLQDFCVALPPDQQNAVVNGPLCKSFDPLQQSCMAARPDQQNVFVNGLLCKNPTDVKPTDFSSVVLRDAGNTANSLGSNVTLASVGNFGGLNTQGLSFARIDFAKDGIVPPHNHPRATEVTFVEQGTLYVGFVDTNNTLFAQTLYPGDLFVFPRGLVHFLLNVGKTPALSLSALNSQNPGATILPTALFSAVPPISEKVLERSFDLSASELKRIRANL